MGYSTSVGVEEPVVQHNKAAGRFEVRIDGAVAFLTYEMARNGAMVILHTEVPPSLEGRGIGGRLAGAALDWAASGQRAVVVRCPFVRSYIRKHPEYARLVEPGGIKSSPKG